MFVHKFFNSKIGVGLITIGIGFTIIGVVLTLAAFGITFGTSFLIVMGLFLVIYGMTFATTVNKKMNFKLLLAQRMLSWLLILGLISFIWIENLILQSQKSDANVKVKYAVVLGAGIQGEEPSSTLKRRLDKSIEYLNINPNTQIVASGGFGKGATVSEAEVMKRYFQAHGIDESRIIKEERSTTSDENLKYTKELLISLNGEEIKNILIITSEYHMFRAKHMASRYYSNVYGVCSETPTTVMINYAIREYMAVLKMLILDTPQ